MPRPNVPTRCQLCRRRKKKCDGNSPCETCKAKALDCVYVEQQVAAVEPQSPTAREPASPKAAAAVAPRPASSRVSKRRASRSEIPGIKAGPSSLSAATASSSNMAKLPEEKPVMASSSRVPLPSYVSALVVGTKATTSLGVAIPSQPALSIEPSTTLAATAAGTNLVSASLAMVPSPHFTSSHEQLSAAHAINVLDSVLRWECLAFCLVNRQEFRSSHCAGTRQYSSRVLVDALLALAGVLFQNRKLDEIVNDHTGKPVWDTFCTARANEAAQTLYHGTWPPQRLPDIQALGVLSSYYICHGRTSEGQRFAKDFAESIIKLCSGTESTSARMKRIRASTYCSAISMNRMMLQIENYETYLNALTQRIFHHDARADFELGRDRQRWADQLRQISLGNGASVDEPNMCLDNLYIVAAEMYLLIEQVFKTCCAPGTESSFNDAVATYSKLLEWYQSFFKYTEICTGCKPLVLFAHTYYHFSILSLLTPYMMNLSGVHTGGSTPGRVCEEAANTVVELVELHDSFSEGARPVGFMDAFKSAATGFLALFKNAQPATPEQSQPSVPC